MTNSKKKQLRRNSSNGNDKTQELISVIVVEPQKMPYLKTIPNNFKAFQAEVGGYIECTRPFDNPVCIIHNEAGHPNVNGLALNRPLRNRNGSISDIIAGTFLIVETDEDRFISLSPEMSKKYMFHFKYPQSYFFDGTDIITKTDFGQGAYALMRERLEMK